MTGVYAVFGFYILSGYLMTLIMHKNYGFTADGIKKYALNRFLRIFPIYWVSIIFSLGLILLVGEKFTSSYHDNIFFPSGLEWFFNLFIIFPLRDAARLTPPAWALTVELFFYVCIGLGLSKRKNVVLWWFFLSVLYHLVVNLLGLDAVYKYNLITAASLPFATGALIYHYRSELGRVFSKFSNMRWSLGLHALLILIFLNWYIGYLTHELVGPFYYVNYGLNAIMIVALKERRSLPLVSRKLDAWMGEFSYPIYLTHLQVGMVVAIFLGWFGLAVKRPAPILFFISIPALLLGAWLLTITVSRPIDSVRERVKKRIKHRAPLPSPAAVELTD